MSEPAETARAFLKRATATSHEAVEAAFAPLDLSTLHGLRAFLSAQLIAVSAIEDELEARSVGRIVSDWPERRRKASLIADLAVLDVAPAKTSTTPSAGPVLDSRGRQIGALYVLEGSRLGGRLLARTVESSPDERVRAAGSFLRHQAKPGAWQAFLALLEQADVPRDDLLSGSLDAFALFERVARRASQDLEVHAQL